MNKQARTIILFLGVVAVIFVIVKLVSAHNKSRADKEFERAYDENLVAQQVWCESCGETLPLDVMFKEARRFQVCPGCGAKEARPIVYFMCGREGCDQKLFSVRNHVFDGPTFYPGPDPIDCPSCGQPDRVNGVEIHFNKAKEVADKTGQSFP